MLCHVSIIKIFPCQMWPTGNHSLNHEYYEIPTYICILLSYIQIFHLIFRFFRLYYNKVRVNFYELKKYVRLLSVIATEYLVRCSTFYRSCTRNTAYGYIINGKLIIFIVLCIFNKLYTACCEPRKIRHKSYILNPKLINNSRIKILILDYEGS